MLRKRLIMGRFWYINWIARSSRAMTGGGSEAFLVGQFYNTLAITPVFPVQNSNVFYLTQHRSSVYYNGNIKTNRQVRGMSELTEKQIKRLRSLITEAETNLAAARELLMSVLGDGEVITAPRATIVDNPEGTVIEGVFDGQIMIGPDGKNYPVPANYASKSRLVEGDIMKLTIAPDGKFLYKQIGPVERKTVIGTLVSRDDQYFVEVNGKEYKILYASVTYFKLKTGDQVSVVVPAENDDATWAAVEASI